ncbi:MAG: ADP-ribosylglycohydrolase family protein [Fluviicola sp.]
MKIATKDTWKVLPMSIPEKFDIDIEFNEIEFEKIKVGLIPDSMDDKWFVYFEDGWLYLHRSWTGHLIFKANIQAVSNGNYVIKAFYAEQDKERWKVDNREEILHSFKNQLSYLSKRSINNPVKNAILGLTVGDVLGVPVEFQSRARLKESPVTDLRAFGTHNQPIGTWSDDTSLSLCLADELSKSYNLANIGNSFVKWYYEGHWTPFGKVFDVGMTTGRSIERIAKGESPEFSGECDEGSNGNGSLMRILPLLFYIESIKDKKDKYQVIKEVSGITHAHVRSCLACYYLLEFASFASADYKYPLIEAYKVANHGLIKLVNELEINQEELQKFQRLTDGRIHQLEEKDIYSSGYVIHSLEASVWCLLTTKSYKEAVLKAVNLGGDTDTIGSITGGLAGLYYGSSSIPGDWIEKVVRLTDIEKLMNDLSDAYGIVNC